MSLMRSPTADKPTGSSGAKRGATLKTTGGPVFSVGAQFSREAELKHWHSGHSASLLLRALGEDFVWIW